MSTSPGGSYSVSTPEEVTTRLGTFRFGDGIPTHESAEALYDQLDFHHGIDAYLNGLPAVSLAALRQGFLDAGVNDNDVLVFSGLMDAASLFLTANCDTVLLLDVPGPVGRAAGGPDPAADARHRR